MLKFVFGHLKFLDKSVWISLRNVGLGSFDCGLLPSHIEAVRAAAFWTAKALLSKALTVELEAFGAGALTLVREHHRCPLQEQSRSAYLPSSTFFPFPTTWFGGAPSELWTGDVFSFLDTCATDHWRLFSEHSVGFGGVFVNCFFTGFR